MFTVPVPPDTFVRPWKESNEFPHKFYPRDYIDIDYPSADWLPDDPPSCHHMFSQDSFAIVEGSSWHKWTPEEGKQEIAILVLEKLGSHYYPEDDEPKTDREALRYVHSSLASGRKLKLFVYSVNRYAMLSTTSASAVYYTKTLLHTISFVLLWRSARSTRRHTTGGW